MTIETTPAEGATPPVTTATEGATPPVAPPANAGPTAEEWASTQAELSRLRGVATSANEQAKNERLKANEERDAKIAALTAKGEFGEALELHKAQLADAEAYKTDAEKWRGYTKAAEEKIALELAGDDLPDYVKDAAGAMPDAAAKRAFLDGYRKTLDNAPAPTVPSAQGHQTGGNGSHDWKTLNAQGGAALESAMHADPKGWQAHLNSQSGRRRASH